ncbi:hypothetical protein LEMA_P087830.1 [Plenodomus lingam JN3]|uniref:GAT domain-containing protein n=1 Tax=Leptosphaeria maculans (strain JN3 / isolate v23.1.3 / race Av1-4-5-6-7-8) TaxID=985895 RepID=E5A7E9_LEPMJ|nr:hypothetical protein LEMA_P087830.1 [Plenodomus lingam JN3]CBX99544.1 hypothetical protein LEMA_P087830.1 [Plenodomus lingam JN3]
MVELKKHLNLSGLMRKRSAHNDVLIDSEADTPEANAARGVKLFCESGAANTPFQGEEVLHLPTIVEAAVASPLAAASAARQIRVFLSKDNYSRPHVQYNSVMLIRILTDNPGPSFTKNLDKQFADTVKHLLRNGNDPSVSQIMRETLDSMERDKGYDTNLNALFAMWKKEKGLMETATAKLALGPRKLNAPAWSTSQQIHGGFGSGSSSSRGLPPPLELAGRIEEARTSAKLLLQLVQSTPANELLANELVKEFAERCTTAQRSVQAYIACDNPAPDDDTMLTLIETNEQLSLAASKHQRAILQARRLMGASPSPPVQNDEYNSVEAATEGVPPPPRPIQQQQQQQPSTFATPQDASSQPSQTRTNDLAQNSNPNLYSSLPASLQAAPAQKRSGATEENPFADPNTRSDTPPPELPSRPQQDGRVSGNGHGGSPESYNPGYQSTPSYLGRQDSSAHNLTMHGGVQTTIAEEDPYPPPQRSRTPELHLSQPSQAHDASPVADRKPVTYRY